MDKKQQAQALIEQLLADGDNSLNRLIGELTAQHRTNTEALLAMAGEHANRMATIVSQQHDLMRELMHQQLVQTDPRAAFQTARFAATMKRAGARQPEASAKVPDFKPSSGPGTGAGHLDEEEDMEPVDQEEILGDLNPRGTGVAGFSG